ncbi:hypothetical protein EXIGLDRAFT_65004 [Exidia glandulosa HHB12029]|uniref:AIG1-type G domain-containing protein n=1 Tax=Exidia glandulosa HHB12029 TaxID=1314781 RepID=A0A165P230_EXIGL|nr:hypothetical protein EXIGLDRAFT_65004 [Exidia glandulosa HHB12029]
MPMAMNGDLTSGRPSDDARPVDDAQHHIAVSPASGPAPTGSRRSSLPGPLQPLMKSEITIILVGETGVGKTTFMSLLANVAARRSVLEFQPQHNRENDSKLDASKSQTKAAMLYEIQRYDGVLLRILDTPGLCDTRGVEQDAVHKASIANAIREHIGQVDAILVMANGTNERLTVPTDYALNTLSAMFPASIAGNIGFLFTMVDNLLSFNFQQSSLPDCLQDAELYTIQNPLALVTKYRERLQTAALPTPSQAKIFHTLLTNVYDTTMETLNSMFEWIDDLQPVPTAEISVIYNMTTGIESGIADVLARLRQMERKRAELSRLQHDIDSGQQVMKINKQYEKIMRREMHVQIDTPTRHTTQCTVADCYSNCHQDCNLEFLLDPAQLGGKCTAFMVSRCNDRTRDALEQTCTACSHAAREHRHFHSYWGLETQEERTVDHDAKMAYEKAEQEVEKYEKQKRLIEASLTSLDDDILTQEKRLSTLCDEFQQLALTGNFAGHLAATIRMLEYRRESRKAAGDVDGMRSLTRVIESLEAQMHVLQEVEQKKKANWSLRDIPARAFSAVTSILPSIRWR